MTIDPRDVKVCLAGVRHGGWSFESSSSIEKGNTTRCSFQDLLRRLCMYTYTGMYDVCLCPALAGRLVRG